MIKAKHIWVFCRLYCISHEKPLGQVLVENGKTLISRNRYKSKVNRKELPPRTTVDLETVTLLEHLSLVDFTTKQSIEVLENSIQFADSIQLVDTTGIEPLVTVCEDRPLILREDTIVRVNTKEDILKNASLLEEDYFVTPPGNIPLPPTAFSDDVLEDKKDS